MTQILLLAGPSGVGKSHIASQHLTERGWIHIETDRYPEGDGIDLEQLRDEWDEFLMHYSAAALKKELFRRASDSPLVMSLPGNLVFDKDHLQAAAGHFVIAYLYGLPRFCLRSFLKREKLLDRGLDEDHWHRYNGATYAALSLPMNNQLRVQAFREDGSRRSADVIYADIISRMKAG